jgi:hypothetical protein
MSRIVSLLLVAACLLLPAFDAIAQVEPKAITKVYRADSRPPAEIFAHGFQGRGANMDLLAHTLGESCEETSIARASTWVSMSADRETAVGFAEGHLESLADQGPEHAMFLYRIRPDNTYLDVHGVMLRAIAAGMTNQRGYTPVQAYVLENLLYSTVIAGEEEVVAHYVNPANIISAQRLHYDAQDNLVRGAIVANPAYRPENTQANDEVVNLQAVVPASSIRVGYGADDDTDGSCSMACDGAGAGIGSRNVLTAAYGSAQCSVRSGFSPLLLDIIND